MCNEMHKWQRRHSNLIFETLNTISIAAAFPQTVYVLSLWVQDVLYAALSKTNKTSARVLAHKRVWECVPAYLSHANWFRDAQKDSGTILNSKVALTDCWTSLTGARRRSREGCLANNVIVMAFVISISRLVLKHRALSGGISVNLGHNTLPINSSTYAYCWPRCLSLITFRQQNGAQRLH